MSASIGVFDSGLGGLTVVRELRRRFPGEAICYLGDTARVPYGTKSARTVERYALRCQEFLLSLDVKLALITFTTIPILLLGSLAFRLASVDAFARTRETIGAITAQLQETLSGVRIIRSYGREAGHIDRFHALNDDNRAANMKTVYLNATYFPAVEYLSTAAIVIVLLVGGGEALTGAVTLDELAERRGRMNPRLDPAWLRYLVPIGARHDDDGCDDRCVCPDGTRPLPDGACECAALTCPVGTRPRDTDHGVLAGEGLVDQFRPIRAFRPQLRPEGLPEGVRPEAAGRDRAVVERRQRHRHGEQGCDGAGQRCLHF